MVIAETDGLVAWCPFASRFAYEVCVAPKRHAARFQEIDDASLVELAGLVRRVLGRIELDFRDPQYNLILQSAPFSGQVEDCLHWRIEILPRTAKAAGFEWGTQCFINAVSPESAADPLPQAFALTAIVIAFSITIYMLTLAATGRDDDTGGSP